MDNKYLGWFGLLLVTTLLFTACSEETPTPTPTTAPTVSGFITVTAGTATPRCRNNPPTGWASYTVQEADTLTELAISRGVTVEEIRIVNCLTSNTILAGNTLYLPQLPTPTPCLIVPPDDWAQYQTRSGDTLSELASGLDTSVETIVQINCLVTETILIGENIYLPKTPTPTPTDTPTFTPTPIPTPLPTATPQSPTALGVFAPNQPVPAPAPIFNPPDGGPPNGGGGNPQPQPEISLPDILFLGGGGGGGGSCFAYPPINLPIPSILSSFNEALGRPRATDVCLLGVSLDESIVLNFTSPDSSINLSGTFVVRDIESEYGIFPTVISIDPIEGVISGLAGVVSGLEQTTAIYIALSWPVGLPAGTWSVTARTSSLLLSGSFEAPSVYRPELSTVFDPDQRKLRIGEGCYFLTSTEIGPFISIVGRGFPPNSPIAFGLYNGRLDPVNPSPLIEKHILITDHQGDFRTRVSIDSTETGKTYSILAVSKTDPDFVKGGVLSEEIDFGAFNCFTIPAPQPTVTSSDTRDVDAPDNQGSDTTSQTQPTPAAGVAADQATPVAASATTSEPDDIQNESQSSNGCLSLIVVFGIFGVIGVAINKRTHL